MPATGPGRGSAIILNTPPKGVFEECIVSGTPKPGTCMEIVPATDPQGGRFTYRFVTRTDGAVGPVTILDADWDQGKTATDAYVTLTRGFLYWPIQGEEFNMLLRFESGTGTSGEENIGDLLAIDGSTGMLQSKVRNVTTAASAPFLLLDHLGTSLTTNTLVWTKFLGTAV